MPGINKVSVEKRGQATFFHICSISPFYDSFFCSFLPFYADKVACPPFLFLFCLLLADALFDPLLF
jgi:hypothetical protein